MSNNIVPNYKRFDSDGLELVVNTDTGVAYASISAAARMLDRNESTIRSAIASRKIDVVSADIETDGGLQGSRLIDSETLYDMALDYNKGLAKKMGSAGANLYMLKLAGYEIKPAEKAPTTLKEALILALAKEEEIERLALENKLLEEENQELSEVVDDLFNYSSIIRIAKFNNCSEKLFNWRLLKNASANLKVEIKSVQGGFYNAVCV